MADEHDEAWDALLAQADAYVRAEAVGSLERVAAELVALDPEAPDGYEALADAAGLRGHHARAVARYRDALERDPESVDLLCSLATAQRLAEEPDEAERTIDRALERAPRDADCWIEKAAIHDDQGDRRAAEAAIEKALELRPTSADALHLQALFASNAAPRTTHAHAAQFLRALESRPDDEEIHHHLASVYVELGELDSAYRHVMESLRLDPTDAEVRDTLFEIVAMRSPLYRILSAPGRWIMEAGRRTMNLPTPVVAMIFASGLGAVLMALLLGLFILYALTLRPLRQAYEDLLLARLSSSDVPGGNVAALGLPRARLRWRALGRIAVLGFVWFVLYRLITSPPGGGALWTVAQIVGVLLVIASLVLAIVAFFAWRDEVRRDRLRRGERRRG